MADMEVSNSPPSGLFFAGSDDGETENVMEGLDESEIPATPPAPSSPRSSLFLPDSDDEDSPEDIEKLSLLPKKRLVFEDDDSDGDVEIPEPSDRASSIISIREGSTTSDFTPSLKPPSPIHPPTKKRRLSPPDTHTSLPPMYLGEILIPNAWSNVSGKGYIKPNEPIQIQRDDQGESRPGSSKSGAAQAKKGDGKKQLSIAAMLKGQPTKQALKKKKADNIVRILNIRGFGDCPVILPG